jgi:hypothetical protein
MSVGSADGWLGVSAGTALIFESEHERQLNGDAMISSPFALTAPGGYAKQKSRWLHQAGL